MKLIQWIIRIIIALVFCIIPIIELIFLMPERSNWYIDMGHILLVAYFYAVIGSFTVNHILKSFDKWFESKLK